MLDAYTIRKVAPRILLAAVAINLSLYLCIAAIDITNVVGGGLGELLRQPFIDGDTFEELEIESNLENDIVGIIGAGLMGFVIVGIFANPGAAGAIGLAILCFLIILLITLMFVALAVLVTLVVRYGLLVFLSIVSPIAIACYVFPGTEKYFQRWWELFLKTLIVYPIIAAIFAMSDVMGAIFLTTASEGANDALALVSILTTVIAVFAPMFMIPFAFKFAGGLIGAAYDFANKQSSKGAGAILGNPDDPDSFQGRLRRNSRQRLAANNLSSKAISARVNPMLRGTARQDRLKGIRTAYDHKYAQENAKSMFAQAGAGVDEAQMDMAMYKDAAASRAAIANGTHVGLTDTQRDIAQRIASGQTVTAAERQSLEQRQAQLRMYSSWNDSQGRTRTSRVAAAKSQAALSYGYNSGAEGWQQAVNTANDIFDGDDAEVKNFLNEFQYVAKQAGRSDLAGNVNSTSYDLDKATEAQSTYQLLNGKPSAVEALIDQHTARLNSATATDKDRRKSAVFLHELATSSAKGQGTGAVRESINKNAELMNNSLDGYYQSKAVAAANNGEPPPPIKELATEQVADPNNPNAVITRRRLVERTPTTPDEIRRARLQQAKEDVEKESRAYTPIDPNEREK